MKLQKRLSVKDSSSASIASSIITKFSRRNKLIRIADKSSAGWTTFQKYESGDLASDSDEENRMRQADNRALRKLRERRRYRPYKKPSAAVSTPSDDYSPAPTPFVTTRSNVDNLRHMISATIAENTDTVDL